MPVKDKIYVVTGVSINGSPPIDIIIKYEKYNRRKDGYLFEIINKKDTGNLKNIILDKQQLHWLEEYIPLTKYLQNLRKKYANK